MSTNLRALSPREEEKSTGQVRALARALSILREVGSEDDGLTLTEVAGRVGLAPSTAHRLLTTLESQRFARLSSSDGRWRVGVETFATGAAFARSRNLTDIARDALEALAASTQETAALFAADMRDAICLHQIESHHPVRVSWSVGSRRPLEECGAGKAILAMSSALKARAAIANDAQGRRAALETEFAAIRQTGVGVDAGRSDADVCSISAALFDETGAAIAAISVAGPVSRIPETRRVEIAKAVSEAAAAATGAYGGKPPRAA